MYCAIVLIIFLWGYPNPVYWTPSFDDSISFAFVLIGIVVGTRAATFKPLEKQYTMEELGAALVVLRIILGVAVILVWRLFAKAVCGFIFPPLFKYFDYESSLTKKDAP